MERLPASRAARQQAAARTGTQTPGASVKNIFSTTSGDLKDKVEARIRERFEQRLADLTTVIQKVCLICERLEKEGNDHGN